MLWMILRDLSKNYKKKAPSLPLYLVFPDSKIIVISYLHICICDDNFCVWDYWSPIISCCCYFFFSMDIGLCSSFPFSLLLSPLSLSLSHPPFPFFFRDYVWEEEKAVNGQFHHTGTQTWEREIERERERERERESGVRERERFFNSHFFFKKVFSFFWSPTRFHIVNNICE